MRHNPLMRVKFLGSGDAFGSGGRLNSCFLLDDEEHAVLIDCGASAMISIRRFGVDPNRISAILLSHLHADHFGGLPAFILDGQLVSRRERPLVICGPQGLTHRLQELMEAHFPGSSRAERKFPVEIVELTPEAATGFGTSDATVTGHEVRHPSGTPSLALRIVFAGKTIAYTGDTEWVDALLPACRNADLLIAESYFFDRKVRFHLDYETLRSKLAAIAARRVVLTHMSPDMLSRRGEVGDCLVADDGFEVFL